MFKHLSHKSAKFVRKALFSQKNFLLCKYKVNITLLGLCIKLRIEGQFSDSIYNIHTNDIKSI